MHVTNAPLTESRAPILINNFSYREAEDVNQHEDNPMVNNLQIHYWNVKSVMIDPNNLEDILYWEDVQGLELDLELLQPFKGSLLYFSGVQVHVLDYVTNKTAFGINGNSKTITLMYMVINSLSHYNIIIRRPSFNTLKAVLSTLYLTMKYLLSNERVGVIKGNHYLARKCYRYSLKLKKKINKEAISDMHKIHYMDIDPRGYPRRI